MSFIIKCNKCGNEQEFTDKSNKYGDNIYIDVFIKGTYMGDCIKGIDLVCENPKCVNSIEIKY